MHSVWYKLGLMAATAFVLAGCATTDPIKAPKRPEEYTVPPTEDARYSQPPSYPKDVLNQDRIPVTSNGMPLGKGPGGGRAGGPGGPGGF